MLNVSTTVCCSRRKGSLNGNYGGGNEPISRFERGRGEGGQENRVSSEERVEVSRKTSGGQDLVRDMQLQYHRINEECRSTKFLTKGAAFNDELS